MDPLETIRRLRRLAASTSSPEEAATAAATAQSLIDRHRISVEVLDEDNGWGEQDIEMGSRQVWHSALAFGLAKHNGCILFVSRAGRWNRLTFFGRKEDATVAKELYSWAKARLAMLAPKRKRSSWLLGAAAGFVSAFNRDVARHSSAAIVLCKDSKVAAAQDAYDRTHGKPKTTTQKVRFNREAYLRGYVTGHDVARQPKELGNGC